MCVIPWHMGAIVAASRCLPPWAHDLLTGFMGGWGGMEGFKGSVSARRVGGSSINIKRDHSTDRDAIDLSEAAGARQGVPHSKAAATDSEHDSAPPRSRAVSRKRRRESHD